MSGTPEPDSPGDLPDDELEEFELPDEEDGEEPDPEEVEAEAEPEEPPPQERQTRRQRQENNWRERALRSEAREELLREQRQQQTPRQAPAVDPQAQARFREAEYERISLLPPNEQVRELHGLMQRETALARIEAFDTNDRSNFQRLQDTHPAARRLAPQVEATLQAQRAQGIFNFSREQIYHYLLGQEVHNRASQGATRQRREGAARVARQTTRPGGNRRADVATTGGNRARGEDADRRLLEGTRITDL